jgi:hypothetical protein
MIAVAMPTEFTIDRERRLVRNRAWGVLTDADLAESQQRLRSHPLFEPDLGQLFDCSEVTRLDVTTDGLRALARKSPFAPTARRAVVVNSDEQFGMARMFELISNRDSAYFRVFRSLAEARVWLGHTEGATGEGGG